MQYQKTCDHFGEQPDCWSCVGKIYQRAKVDPCVPGDHHDDCFWCCLAALKRAELAGGRVSASA